ncbi:MAG: periplasmic heavy metal sensor [Kiloniellales bacterium]
MRGKLLWVLLAVSLAANVFLVAGALYGLYGDDTPGARAMANIDTVAERLGLSSEQRDGLVDLRKRVKERRQVMRELRGERRGAFLDELAKPAFDRERVLVLIDQRAAERREFFADMAGELHAYLATLGPEQRDEFLAMARERGFLRRLFGRPRPPRGKR